VDITIKSNFDIENIFSYIWMCDIYGASMECHVYQNVMVP